MTRPDQPEAALARLLAEAQRLGRGDAAAGVAARDRQSLLAAIETAAGPVPAALRERLMDEYRSQHDRTAGREDLVDAGSEMSFPASDPPSYMGSSTTAGAPDHEHPEAVEKPNTRVSDPADVRPAREDITNPGSAADPAAAARPPRR